MPADARLILASASPRRLQLLAQIGITPDEVRPSDIDETPISRELPRQLALRLAQEKLSACNVSDVFVLAADTVVAVGRRLLPKTEQVVEAERCLRLMSGRAHHVLTGVAIRTPSGETKARVVDTRVLMKRLSEGEIATYLESREWQGKAGGYGIQGKAAAFVRSINGSYSNVVGLPLHETYMMLTGLGWR